MNSTIMQRYATKTPQQRFINTLTREYHLAPRVAEEVLFDAQLCLQGQNNTLRPGQICIILAHRDAKAGRSVSALPTVEAIWTVDAGAEDEQIRQSHGSVALRWVRIQRLLCEALEQYAIATQKDLAKALQVSLRTIKRDFKALLAENKVLPSRGYYIGVGRGQTHKAQIIKRWLKGYTYDQIQRDTHHTTTSINRYIQSFVRVVECQQMGFTNSEIAHLLQMGDPLLEEYLAVYERNDHPEGRQRLAEELKRFAKADAMPKKRSRR